MEVFLGIANFIAYTPQGVDFGIVIIVILITLFTYIRSIYLSGKKKDVRTYSSALGFLALILFPCLFFSIDTSELMFWNSNDYITQVKIAVYLPISIFWIGYLIDKIIEKRHKKII